MAEIKSALEIALERAEKIGKASKKELEADRWLNEGRKLGAKYIREGGDLKSRLSGIDPGHLREVVSGVMEVLLRNIVLPREEEQWDGINRAMEGIECLKGSMAGQALGNLRELLSAYQQTRQRYMDQVKMQMQGKVAGLQQMVTQQYGPGMASEIDVEALPEFQQEWSKISGQIDEQFLQQLDPLKRYLENLS